MSATNPNEQPQLFTHIPVLYRDEFCDKTYGSIVLDGAITDVQIEELRAHLGPGESYRPNLLNLNMNRLSDDWHEMALREVEILNYDQPRFGGELDEWPGTVAQFVAAVKDAAARHWRLPGILHIEVSADFNRQWASALSTLTDLAAAIADVTNPEEIAGLADGLNLTAADGRVVGNAWLTY